METTVQMQHALAYNLWPVVIIMLITIAIGVGVFFLSKWLLSQIKPKAKKGKPLTMTQKASAKDRYINKLNKLARDLQENRIGMRECFQSLSKYIRQFVYEVSGVDVTTCTLEEIRGLKMPALEKLIDEYYKPEFEVQSKGDALGAIERTKKVITTWK